MNMIWEPISATRPRINGIRLIEYRSECMAIGIVAVRMVNPFEMIWKEPTYKGLARRTGGYE
jgi:hypothetical protein